MLLHLECKLHPLGHSSFIMYSTSPFVIHFSKGRELLFRNMSWLINMYQAHFCLINFPPPLLHVWSSKNCYTRVIQVSSLKVEKH